MASKKWRLAHSLKKLREQINEAFPNRSKASDGTVADAAHQRTKSDHNINPQGIVNAIDLTHDPANGFDAGVLAETLRASKDRRISYVIFNRQIFSSTVAPWQWRLYQGPNPHDKHIHISASVRYGDDGREWRIEPDREES